MIVELGTIINNTRDMHKKEHFYCPGGKDVTAQSLEQSAFKINDNGNTIDIDHLKCSLCYLCKLDNKSIHLDENYYPIIKENQDTLSYLINDQIKNTFSTKLTEFGETVGISKWLAILLKSYGYTNTYLESALPVNSFDEEIANIFNLIDPNRTYNKPHHIDIESYDEENLFIFENKKGKAFKDEGEGFKQIASYVSSDIFKKGEYINKDKYFILSYDGNQYPANIIKQIMKIKMDDNQISTFKNLFNNPKNNFCIIPSYDFYNLICQTLETGKKDKSMILDLIKSKVIDL